jgi:CRISPR type I-E-associated protein CasA/Cse1
MEQKTEHYNLLIEDWIPVLWNNGEFSRVGIGEAFRKASRIRQIAASNPMDRVSIVRFLLALLYWCKGNVTDEGDAIPKDSFPADWFLKLEKNQDYFNLLGDGKRFYQDRCAERKRPSTDLIQEIPTGNNFWHFWHSTDKIDGLCPACCAMGLLRLPLFSVSGLPDLMSGINGIPPVYVLRWGGSLFDTICANWVKHMQIGDPAWLRPTIQKNQEDEPTLLTGLTLPSRRVWLHGPSGPPGTCGCCGGKETFLIQTCEFQTAGKQENDLWNDPHVVYLDETPRKSLRASDLTAARKFRMDRPWPNLFSRITQTGKFVSREKSTSILVVGFATDKAKNVDVWERTIDLLPSESIQANATSFLRHWHNEGGRLENETASILRSGAMGTSTIATIRPNIENTVSAKAQELVCGTYGWEQAAGEYCTMAHAIAKSLSPGFTTAALQRRQKIACVGPNMRLTTGLDDELSRTEEERNGRNGSVH